MCIWVCVCVYACSHTIHIYTYTLIYTCCNGEVFIPLRINHCTILLIMLIIFDNKLIYLAYPIYMAVSEPGVYSPVYGHKKYGW